MWCTTMCIIEHHCQSCKRSMTEGFFFCGISPSVSLRNCGDGAFFYAFLFLTFPLTTVVTLAGVCPKWHRHYVFVCRSKVAVAFGLLAPSGASLAHHGLGLRRGGRFFEEPRQGKHARDAAVFLNVADAELSTSAAARCKSHGSNTVDLLKWQSQKLASRIFAFMKFGLELRERAGLENGLDEHVASGGFVSWKAQFILQ